MGLLHMFKDVIIPIEVKSGMPGMVQSTERYISEYDPEKALVISERNVSGGKPTFVPFPFVWNLEHYM